MLPTTYRGDAIIDGERISGVLHLNADSVRLTLANNQEVLRWPIGDIGVDAVGKGAYALHYLHDTFTFEPSVDDGLGDEISLRRRFFAPPVEYAEPDPPSRSEKPAKPPEAVDATPPTPDPVAARVAAVGRHYDGSNLFVRSGDRFRRNLLVGSLSLIILFVVAIAVSVVTSGAPTVEAAEEPPATAAAPAPTAAPPPSAAPVPPTTAQPVPTTTSTPATTPPTVASATVTTAPPPTTIPTQSIFSVSPSEVVARWDAAVQAHDPSLAAANLQEGEGDFGFDAGSFVRLQGSVDDGAVSRLALVGDPSGTVEDDRQVLTGLGLTLSLIEPELPPEGRRELLLALGFDVEDPDLGGLDNRLDYREHAYWLRWDTGLERLVLDVRPLSADDS